MKHIATSVIALLHIYFLLLPNGMFSLVR